MFHGGNAIRNPASVRSSSGVPSSGTFLALRARVVIRVRGFVEIKCSFEWLLMCSSRPKLRFLHPQEKRVPGAHTGPCPAALASQYGIRV